MLPAMLIPHRTNHVKFILHRTIFTVTENKGLRSFLLTKR